MVIGGLVFLLAQVAAASPAPATTERRSVSVTVADDKGAPVEGLTADEVAVVENGVARELIRLEPERRPLTLVMVVDTSEEVATAIRLQALDAIASFLARLPSGSRYALWTTGDRPTKAVDYTEDSTQAAKALRRTFYQGGNTLFDAMMEATKELTEKEGARSAVVTISGMGIGFTNYERQQAVRELEKTGAMFLSVLFDEGSAPSTPGSTSGQISRSDYEYVLSNLARSSGGRHETPLSPMGVAGSLQKLTADLRGQYRVSYTTVAGLKDRKLEVHVARTGVKVRIGVSTPQNP